MTSFILSLFKGKVFLYPPNNDVSARCLPTVHTITAA